MSTKSKIISVTGNCIVDNDTAAILIEYICIPSPSRFGKKKIYRKNTNQCEYLKDGRCSLDRNCEIYKNAESELME